MSKKSMLEVTSASLTDVVDALAKPEWVAEDEWNVAVGHVKKALGLLDIDFAVDAGVRSTSVGVNVCKPINRMVLGEERIDKALLNDPTIKMIVEYTGLKLRFILFALKQPKWEKFLAFIKDRDGVVNLSVMERGGGFGNVTKRLYPLLAGFGSQQQRRMYGYQMMWDFIAGQIHEKFGVKVNVRPHEGFTLRKEIADAWSGRADKKKGGRKVAGGNGKEVAVDADKDIWDLVSEFKARVAACLEDITGRRDGVGGALKEAAGRLKEVDMVLAGVERDSRVIAWRLERTELESQLENAKKALALMEGKRVEKIELPPKYRALHKAALQKLERKMPKSLRGLAALEGEKVFLEQEKARLEGQLADLDEQLSGVKVLGDRVKELPDSTEIVMKAAKRAVRAVVEPEAQTKRRQKRGQSQGKPEVQSENGGVAIKTLGDLKANLGAKVVVTVTEKGLVHFEKNNDDLKPLPEVGDVLEMSVVRVDGDRFYSLRGGGIDVAVSRTYVLGDLNVRLADGAAGGKTDKPGKSDKAGKSRRAWEKAAAAGGRVEGGAVEDVDDDSDGDDEGTAADARSPAQLSVAGGSNEDFLQFVTKMDRLGSLDGVEAHVTVTSRNLALLKRGAVSASLLRVGRVLKMRFARAEVEGSPMRLMGEGCTVVLVSDGILPMLRPRIRKQSKPSVRAPRVEGAAVVRGGQVRKGKAEPDMDLVRRVVAGRKVGLAPVDSGNGIPGRGKLKSLVGERGPSFVDNNRDLLRIAGCLAEDYDENGEGVPSREIADDLLMNAGEVKAAVLPLRKCFARLGLDVKVKPQGDGDMLIGFVPLKK